MEKYTKEYDLEFRVLDLKHIKKLNSCVRLKLPSETNEIITHTIRGPFKCKILKDTFDKTGSKLIPKGYTCVVTEFAYNFYEKFIFIKYDNDILEVKPDVVCFVEEATNYRGENFFDNCC